MQQFVVPQFIDVEDKIIGPITTRQFIIIIICGIVLFLEYKLSDMIMFLTIGLPTLGIFGTFAFFRVNGMPFHYFILNIVQTLKRPAIRVWAREIKVISSTAKKIKKGEKELPPIIQKKPVTVSRLSDLSLIIDTGGIYRGAEEEREYGFKIEEDNKF